jgi:oligoendopeptidase F
MNRESNPPWQDVMTVAHELGHGLHGWIARKQTLFNYDTPLTTAETASVFGEFLVFDHLVRVQEDPQVRLALICGKIEDTCATVFRQNVLTRFEQAVFEQRRKGRLTGEAICRAWIEANGRYYGDAVEMTDGCRWGWSCIPHFIHTRFYCYSVERAEELAGELRGRGSPRGLALKGSPRGERGFTPKARPEGFTPRGAEGRMGAEIPRLSGGV